MYKYYEAVMQYCSDSYSSSWKWLNSLDRQNWLYMLAFTTVIGLLCMRGFGSRSNY